MIWNLIGNNFSHTSYGHTGKCGTHGKTPQFITWSKNYEGEISFYLDENIFTKINDRPSLRKVGWLLESKTIKPQLYTKVKEHYSELFNHYECIFTHDRELIRLDPRFNFTICSGYWVKNQGVFSKTKLISAINSGKEFTSDHRFRNRFIERYKDKLDLFGNKYQHIAAKEEGLQDYMFSVAIENGKYTSYFTEKILDCFATGTIPIYRGAPDIGSFFNSDGIIIIDDDFSIESLTPDLYYSKMEAVEDNFLRLRAYHCAEDYIYSTYRFFFH